MIQPVAHPSELAAYAREMGQALREITVPAPLQVSDGQRKASKDMKPEGEVPNFCETMPFRRAGEPRDTGGGVGSRTDAQ